MAQITTTTTSTTAAVGGTTSTHINKHHLKMFVRYDGSRKIVPGGNVLQRTKPKVGNWVEIPAYECCNSTTTTSTTVQHAA